MPHILLVEDDRPLAQGVADALAADGRTITVCGSARQARQAMESPIDLAILDVGLPDGNGLELCRELRLFSRAPVLFLTACDAEADEVAGFAAGGDDYIAKPFRVRALRARVDALLRRAVGDDIVERGGLRLDFAHADFTRDGVGIALSAPEQRLLRALVSAPGQTLPRETLTRQVWGLEAVEENALSVTVRRLRKKLGEGYIQTIYGVGYRWGTKDDR